MTTHTRKIDLDGTPVTVHEWMPEQHTGATLLLLHGGGADSAQLSWGEVGPALAAHGHRVLAPDYPGFGLSPRSDVPLTQPRLVEYVGAVIDALELDDYVIGGLSMGGGATIGHLLDQPGRASGAILLGSYGLMPRIADGALSAWVHFGTWLLVRTGALNALTAAYARNPALMEKGLRDLVRNDRSRTPELVEAVLAEARSGSGTAVFAEWQRDQVLATRLRTDYRAQLASIRTPVLVVHGDHDRGVPIARATEAARALPHAELCTVEGAGHWVQRDRPDVVIPALLDHLRMLADA